MDDKEFHLNIFASTIATLLNFEEGSGICIEYCSEKFIVYYKSNGIAIEPCTANLKHGHTITMHESEEDAILAAAIDGNEFILLDEDNTNDEDYNIEEDDTKW